MLQEPVLRDDEAREKSTARRPLALVALAAGALGVLVAVGPSTMAAERRAPVAVTETVDDEDMVVEVENDAAYLGVHLREDTGPEGGAHVVDVVENSPAARAGLAEGDVIVEFGGAAVRGPAALTERLHVRKPGERVKVTVLRDGERKPIEIELGSRPDEVDTPEPLVREFYRKRAPGTPEERQELRDHLRELTRELGRGGTAWAVPFHGAWNRPKLGVQLVETTPELREHLGGSEEAGVLVSKILPGTPAERAGIKIGDLILAVDGHDVATAEALIEALEDKEGATFPVRVVRDRRTITIQVQIPEAKDEPPASGPRASFERFAAPVPPAPPAPPALRTPRAPAHAPLAPPLPPPPPAPDSASTDV